jgi:phosphatidylglycerophosphate synthase
MPPSKTGDGPISRHLNRRLSGPITALVVKTPVTPNQVSLIAFVLALLAAAILTEGYYILGGVLTQVSSVIDGVDGELARAKHMMTPFGGFLDSVLDRYSDAAIILGMTMYVLRTDPGALVAPVALLALTGSLAISYSRAQAEKSGSLDVTAGVMGLASRDVRLFIIAAGSVLGWVWWSLILLGVLTNSIVILRVWEARRALQPGQ